MRAVNVLWLGGLAWAIGVAGITQASDEGMVAANQVSQANYIELMDEWLYTHDGDSRGSSGAEHDLARDNILALFQSYGLSAELEAFSSGENVVATQVGTVYPDEEYIIGAHYDSVNNPGADDNASGVALVLEAARVISQYPSDYTIRFIAFDREEAGLIGSSAYVQSHSDDAILGMISADMVAYDPDTNHANIYGRTASDPIKQQLAAAVEEYGDGLTYTIGGDTPYSNHAPFEQVGLQACLLIEGEVWSNPYYHTQDDSFDTFGYLNFPYATKMTRSMVGWLVDQAGVRVAALMMELPDGPPTRVTPGESTPIVVKITGSSESYVEGSAQFFYRFDGQSEFASAAMTSLGDGLFEAVLPPAACGDTPEFYFSAEGDDGSVVYLPDDAANGAFTATVATLTVMLDDDFETDQGWTTVHEDLLDGAWQRGIPVGGGLRGDPPVDYDGSGQCFLTGNRAGNSDVDGGPTRLISPVMDVSGVPDPVLLYARWFYNDDQDQDRLEVEVSDDGGASWRLVESVSAAAGGELWIERSIRLADYVNLTSQFRIRFSVMDNPNNSLTEAAIDAVTVYDISCIAVGDGDYDGDGDVDLDDYVQFAACLAGPENGLVGQDCAVFDMDGDEDVDLGDFMSFQAVFGQFK